MSKRVLLAGLFHETHTFLPGRLGLEDFRIELGDELLQRPEGGDSPMDGMIEVAAK